MKEDIYIGKSTISGIGVFASRDFKKGKTICIFKGNRVSVSQLQKIYINGNERVTCDSFQIAERVYLLLDDIYNSINHSCDPNAGVKGVKTLVALRNINKGEEITFDYSATEWTAQDYTAYSPDQWPLKCSCKTPDCRKIIGCFPCLPKNIQKKYISNGIIQNFILRKFAQPKNKTRCYICERSGAYSENFRRK